MVRNSNSYTPPSTETRSLSNIFTLACPEPNVDHDDPTNWRASAQVGGSPGSDDLVALSAWLTSHGLAPGQETSDLDHDGLSALLEYALGTDPTNSHDGDVLHPSVQSLLVGTQTERYLVLQFPRLKGADDVRLSAEVSVDLISWDPAGPLIDSQSSAGNPVELLKIRSNTAVGPDTQFLRIRVEAK